MVLYVKQFTGNDLSLLAPQAGAGIGIAKLDGYANRLVGFPDAAAQHVAHSQSSPGLAWIEWASAIGQRRPTGYDGKFMQSGQRDCDILHNTVGKIIVGRIAADVP